MRIAIGLLASATVLFLTSAAGVVGIWGLVAGVGLGVAAAVSAVVAMEERELLVADTPTEAALLARLDVTR